MQIQRKFEREREFELIQMYNQSKKSRDKLWAESRPKISEEQIQEAINDVETGWNETDYVNT